MNITKWWGNLFNRKSKKATDVMHASKDRTASNNSNDTYATSDELKFLREHNESAHRYYLTKHGYEFLNILGEGVSRKDLKKLASIDAMRVFLDILGFLGMKSDLMKEAIKTGNAELAVKLANQEPKFDESFTLADISKELNEDPASLKGYLELGIQRGYIGVYYMPK